MAPSTCKMGSRIFALVVVRLCRAVDVDGGGRIGQTVPAVLDFTWEPDPKAFLELPAGVGYLRKMLQQAMEVEQSLVAPYISAAYSIQEGTNTNASRLVHGMAIEEMMHMAAMANVLNAVGGHPQINHPAFAPKYPQTLPFEQKAINLAPFNREQVEAFREIEKPNWSNPSGHTVGLFFMRIMTLMEALVLWHGEAAVFAGDPQLQVTLTTAEGGVLPKVKSHADATYIMLYVGMQGEGGVGNFYNQNPFVCPAKLEHPHYYRFVEVLKGRFYRAQDMLGHVEDPTGDPLDMDWDAVRDFRPNPRAEDYMAHPDLYEKMTQFKVCYSNFLEVLDHAFNGAPETFMSSVGGMYHLARMAKELIATPAPGHPGKTVGPPWEWMNTTEVNISCPTGTARVVV